MRSKTTIVVTDAEQRSSLAAVRSLGRAGYRVIACSAVAKPLAGASRYCRRSYLVPDPTSDVNGFRSEVRRIVEEESADVLLPMTDVSAPLLIPLRDEIPGLLVPYPELAAYEGASDKGKLVEVARELGVPVPDQVVIDSPRALSDAEVERLGLPLILKPARSAVTGRVRTVRLAVRLARSSQEAEDILMGYPPEAFPVLAQRRILGPGLGVFLLSWDGDVIATFSHRRIREKPPTGGVSVYRESAQARPDLVEYGRRLLDHFGWRGVAMVEFKEDSATGTPYLMEINARFWGSLQLAIDAGVDFPALLIGCATGERPTAVASYREGVRSRWLWGDVDHLIWILRAAPGYRVQDPELPGRWGAVARFLLPWRPGDRWEVLRPTDPGPFLRECGTWLTELRQHR